MQPSPWAETWSSPSLRWGYLAAILEILWWIFGWSRYGKVGGEAGKLVCTSALSLGPGFICLRCLANKHNSAVAIEGTIAGYINLRLR